MRHSESLIVNGQLLHVAISMQFGKVNFVVYEHPEYSICDRVYDDSQQLVIRELKFEVQELICHRKYQSRYTYNWGRKLSNSWNQGLRFHIMVRWVFWDASRTLPCPSKFVAVISVTFSNFTDRSEMCTFDEKSVFNFESIWNLLQNLAQHWNIRQLMRPQLYRMIHTLEPGKIRTAFELAIIELLRNVSVQKTAVN
jgi:hypothetical protein